MLKNQEREQKALEGQSRILTQESMTYPAPALIVGHVSRVQFSLITPRKWFKLRL